VNASASKIFVSYRREDAAGHAGRIYDAIVARFGERNVFMDVDLAPGVDFIDRITEAVDDSDVLLVIIGPQWATVSREGGQPRLADPGDYVRLEVETALGRPELKVIPLLVAGARMPDPDDLPESMRALSRRNALELTDARWRYDVGRLVNTLAGVFYGGPAEAEGPDSAAPAPPRGRRSWALVGAALTVVVVVVVLAVAGVFSSGNGGTSASTGSNAALRPDAGTLTHQYEQLYETKDLNGLRKIMRPDVVLKRGASFQRNGIEEVIAEYRREFKRFGNRQPAFDWDIGGSDSREALDEVHGPYVISANGVPQQRGTFGTLAVTVGSKTLIKELCFNCPDLHHPGGFIAS
jgi:TIR domain